MARTIIILAAVLTGLSAFASETIWLIGDSTVASYNKKSITPSPVGDKCYRYIAKLA
jgi:hypothetical protein